MEDIPLFQGLNQFARHSRLFFILVKDNVYELKTMGVGEGYLGTHSCSNGVSTMVAAGCTVYPPIVSVCIYTGWLMGGEYHLQIL